MRAPKPEERRGLGYASGGHSLRHTCVLTAFLFGKACVFVGGARAFPLNIFQEVLAVKGSESVGESSMIVFTS